MFLIKKIIFYFIFFLLTGFLPISKSHASSENFQIDLTTTYQVNHNQVTTVSHQFLITNTTPTSYLKQYALATTYPSLEEVSVFSNGQPISPHIVSNPQGTSIAINFPDELVGEGKTRNLTISYRNPYLANIGGNVLEIHVPKLENISQYSSIKTILKTPAQFGSPVRINPQPTAQRVEGNETITEFKLNEGESISALYGTEQYYSLTLRYHLENNSSNIGLAQIALPPDTPYQKMNYVYLDPLPNEIKSDLDGNWIATYRLPPTTTQIVNASLRARLKLDPDPDIFFTPIQPFHTVSQEFWEINHPNIIELANQHQSPLAIFNFVVNNLEYSRQNSFASQIRLGAVQTLNQPDDAVCQEFTDLFIAIARSAGIPARRLTGYAFSQNSTLRPLSLEGDILHAWPEYFHHQQQKWVQVDPTWTNTTGGIDYFSQFDLNHLVFAINGESSSRPFPAGSYKAVNSDSKDIEVKIVDSFIEANPEFNINLQNRSVAYIPFPGSYWISISNQTGQAWYNLSLNISQSSSTSEVLPRNEIQINSILPFQTLEFPISIANSSWSLFTPEEISVTITNKNQINYVQKNFSATASHTLFGLLGQPPILIGLGAGLAFATLVTGSILVFRRR